MEITGLYQAKVARIGPKNELTGIYKYPITSATVNQLGILGDTQVDKRYHGGPERALHQYAFSSYEKIIKGFPLLRSAAWPGSMGENISVKSMNEQNVCIGDIYQMGDIQVQVAGPRMPCFKIAAKFKTPNLDKFVAKHAIHGWYYRVTKNGTLSLGDSVVLLERPNPNMTIALFLKLVQKKTSEQVLLSQASDAQGLDPEWRDKLLQRLK